MLEVDSSSHSATVEYHLPFPATLTISVGTFQDKLPSSVFCDIDIKILIQNSKLILKNYQWQV